MANASKIPHRYLGSSGLKVSALCLGTMTFGQDVRKTVITRQCYIEAGVCLCVQSSRPGCDEAGSHALLDRYILDLGGNFIDTSDVYQIGMSESIIGRWLEKHPRLRSKVSLCFAYVFSIAAPHRTHTHTHKHMAHRLHTWHTHHTHIAHRLSWPRRCGARWIKMM